jgi:hypothetical protein
MYKHLSVYALAAAATFLAGCDGNPDKPVTPMPDLVRPVTSQAPTTDASVPPAASVITPGAVPKPETPGARTNRSMTRAEESSAMPMPGQNNDHSAPLAPSKGASAP